MADAQTVNIRITGRVQGVGFREWTRQEAIGLGLTGWVRNETDGSVSGLIHGDPVAVKTMLERLWTGPALASVSAVKAQPMTVDDVPAVFEIRR